jgi:hypothetical protein
MPKTFTLDDDRLKNLEAVCANRWPAVRRILGIPVESAPDVPVDVPDPKPVDRAGRVMVDDDGEPVPVKKRKKKSED